jgi:predicted  nucleic acid-binding Zn-ribbon protein
VFNQFTEKTEPEANQTSGFIMQWELPKLKEASITLIDDEVSGSVVQLTEEENKLRSEKQLLLKLIGELENRLTNEIKTRKSTIATLKFEVCELRNRCEELARALNIPVIK